MERNEADSSVSNLGKKFEPAFAPEWLKTTASTPTSLDDHGTATTPRNARNSVLYRRSYTSNGSHHHERNIHERDISSNPDSIASDVFEKDTLRRSHSMTSRGVNSAWAKKSGIEAISTSGGNGIVKVSFEREFPHLGAEDNVNKHGLPEASKFQGMPFYSSAVVGGDGWNSVLAEMPEPFWTRNPVKESDDSLKSEELEVKMSRQLIPKTSANFAEKVKSKGSRAVGLNVKVGQQPQAQVGAHKYRGLSRSDTPKTPQLGNFQVLNREKNGVSPPPTQDAVVLTGGQRPTPVVNGPLKTLQHVMPNGKSMPISAAALGDKRTVCHQNRSDFFNSLRKKTSENAPLAAPEKFESSDLGQTPEKNTRMVYSSSESASGSATCDGHAGVPPLCREKSWAFDPAEEERLLHLFGWKEDTGEEEGLTAAEIDAFIIEYEKRRPASEYCHRSLMVAKTMLTEMGGSR